MFRKTLAAMALGILMAGSGAPAAKADVDITINLGYGGFYGRNISCRTGARIVAQRFNYVSVRECGGKAFTYLGRRNGKWFVVKVSSATGRIVDVVRIRR